MATPYITGMSALCLFHPGRAYKPFWHSAGSPDRWHIAGQHYPDTSSFFGDQELVDLSELLTKWGIKAPIFISASYERAVFDILYNHIELENRVVPNVQPSDIDDAVDFSRVLGWVSEWERRSDRLKRGPAMRAWLETKRTW
jgi:hypothetical protein